MSVVARQRADFREQKTESRQRPASGIRHPSTDPQRGYSVESLFRFARRHLVSWKNQRR